jgi:hypothetical protein
MGLEATLSPERIPLESIVWASRFEPGLAVLALLKLGVGMVVFKRFA